MLDFILQFKDFRGIIIVNLFNVRTCQSAFIGKASIIHFGCTPTHFHRFACQPCIFRGFIAVQNVKGALNLFNLGKGFTYAFFIERNFDTSGRSDDSFQLGRNLVKVADKQQNTSASRNAPESGTAEESLKGSAPCRCIGDNSLNAPGNLSDSFNRFTNTRQKWACQRKRTKHFKNLGLVGFA